MAEPARRDPARAFMTLAHRMAVDRRRDADHD
jgi:hypothetical protein